MVLDALTWGLGLFALGIVGYYVGWAVLHLAFVLLGVVEFRERAGGESLTDGPALTVAVPAYNEVETIVACVDALLAQSYPLSVVVVDDGSTDGTFGALEAAYALAPRESAAGGGSRVESVAEASDAPLTVLRQQNSGKAAALNAALELCDTPLFGVVDADTVPEPGAIGRLLAPFEDESTAATCGSFRVTRPEAVADWPENGRLSPTWFERLQALDHLRVFVLRQLGRARLGAMTHVFGACCAYRTEDVRAVDGFSDVETEDFELALAVERHCHETRGACRVVHVPDAVVWTTVPETARELAEQRQRWVRGATETVAMHRGMLGRPRYGRQGVFGLPYFLFGEILWPVVEGVGYLVVPLAWLAGAVSTAVLALFFGTSLLLGPATSIVAILATASQSDGYGPGARRALVGTALVERLGWRPAQVFLGTYAVVDYFR